MGKNNFELLKIAQSHLGQNGTRFRKFCGLPAGSAWCNAFVDYVANEGGDSSLYFNGSKMTYCPTSMKWCQNNLAQIPIYLTLPMDIIYFDWEPNGVPNHIGFVRERKSDLEVYTIEGNTSGGIVAQKTRTEKYVCGCFRPHFKPSGVDASKRLSVDGYFGYNTIAVMQRWLGVDKDAVLGQKTVKALQKKLGVTADGMWGTKTTKVLQKLVGVTADGMCGPDTVKALQRYLNTHAFAEKVNSEVNIPKPAAKKDPLQPWFDAMEEQYKWSKNQKYQWVTPTVKSSRNKGTCITFPAVALQRLGLIPSGTYFYFYPKTKKITGKAADIVKKGEKFALFYPNKTVQVLWKEGKIKKGDIVGYGNPNYHTMVFMGMKDGEPIFNTMGGGKRGLKVTYPYYAKRKVNMIVRLKAVK